MIHYHGTPITPNREIETMGGSHFCVSYARPDQLARCLRLGQSVMLDNGAFSTKTRGLEFDVNGFYAWAEPLLRHPHWGVVPDVIDGSVEEQRFMIATWPFKKEFGIPVWHLGLPIDYLLELCDKWGRVCLGSSGEYWQIGTPKWADRMDQAFNQMQITFGSIPWTHGMRMLGQSLERWPLASADSTNVARNHHAQEQCAGCMAKHIDSANQSRKWHLQPTQGNLL
jgi:hypothetical protein